MGYENVPPPAKAPCDPVPDPQDGKNEMYANPEPGQNFPTGVAGVNEGSPWRTPGVQDTLQPKRGY